MDIQKENNKIDGVRIFLIGANLLVVLAVFVVVYWLFFDTNPPAVVNEVYVHEEFVYPGGTYTLHVDWCKYAKGSAVVRAAWVNDLAFTQPTWSPPGSIFPDGECSARDILLQVPTTLPPSDYHIKYTNTWRVNPIQERSIEMEVGPVVVVAQDVYFAPEN
jgi:hypothetical protein